MLVVLSGSQFVYFSKHLIPELRMPLPLLTTENKGSIIWDQSLLATFMYNDGVWLFVDEGEFGSKAVYQPLPEGAAAIMAFSESLQGVLETRDRFLLYGGSEYGAPSAMVNIIDKTVHPAGSTFVQENQLTYHRDASYAHGPDGDRDVHTPSSGPAGRIQNLYQTNGGFVVRALEPFEGNLGQIEEFYVDSQFTTWRRRGSPTPSAQSLVESIAARCALRD
ncbi:MAG: hypothetical protein GXP62_01850 [Oligoflexia bacterium]|nr:hypothetical protein [Oligoflexia bacterium]